MIWFKKVLGFFRWRLVPVRYLTLVFHTKLALLFRGGGPVSKVTEAISSTGFCPGPTLSADQVALTNAIYRPRASSVVPKIGGHPFENLFNESDINPQNPVMQLALSPSVLDVAVDYFQSRVILDSIQVLYSYPTSGALRESQYWHLDYGDSKSLHCVVYLNNVLSTDDGPFVCLDRSDSAVVGRSMLVRRLTDRDVLAASSRIVIRPFFGQAGASILIDPAACYHHGSRCRNARLAAFVTFSSWFPFVPPVPFVRRNVEQLKAVAKMLRPDISEEFWTTFLRTR